MAFYPSISGDILHLNVGGKRYYQICSYNAFIVVYWQQIFAFRFSTSRQTLTSIPDTFFTALLSGRISSLRDDQGAIFIDRDPKIFSVILNYLRTKDIDLKGIDLRTLRHEAEYYAIAPLVKRLMLCEDLTQSTCGDILFYGYLPPPSKYYLYFNLMLVKVFKCCTFNFTNHAFKIKIHYSWFSII